jgi:hypothetical protein
VVSDRKPPARKSARNSSANSGQLVVNTSAMTVPEGIYSSHRRSRRPRPKNAFPGVQEKIQRTANEQQQQKHPTSTTAIVASTC